MKRALWLVSTAFVVALAARSLAAMPAARAVNLTGTWTGRGDDTFVRTNAADGMMVTLVITQSGSTISGTARSTPFVPGDGSCSSCHRDKTGTLSGTLSGTTLTLTLDFPGHNGETTSECVAQFTGTAAIADQTFDTVYTGTDICENLPPSGKAYLNGLLTLTREAETLPAFTSQPASRSIPTGLTASLSATATGTLPLSYQWYSGSTGVTSSPIAGATASSYTTPPVSSTASFWIRVSNAYGSLVNSGTATLTPYAPFTDDALTADTSVIKAVHVQELRTRIDAIRARVGLAAYSYTDATLTAGTSAIRAQHILDLRAALAGAYTAAGRTPPSYADPVPVSGGAIKLLHITELRAAVIAIE